MTLQEQYNLIKEGKGHKDVFLTEAKKLFPNMLTNPMGFDEASKILKTRGVISENYVDLKPITQIEASPKASWENKFAQFLAEEKQKPAKEVEEIQSHGYDYKDKTNLDNQIGQEVLNGIYFEAKENPDKSLDELREIVAKNLAKDGQYYMKNAAFGVKGLGYKETEVQEVSGKYKSSGYSDKLKKMVKESLTQEVSLSDSFDEDDIFVLWDEIVGVDNDRKGISHTNFFGEKSQGHTFMFDEDSPNFEEFVAAVKQKLDQMGLKYKWAGDETLVIYAQVLKEESFEDKMAQLRALKDKQRMGQGPDIKVDNKKQRLQQKLNMLKRAYMDLISDMEKETDLNFAASEDWYQEQLDDMENAISDIEAKLNSIKESSINEESKFKVGDKIKSKDASTGTFVVLDTTKGIKVKNLNTGRVFNNLINPNNYELVESSINEAKSSKPSLDSDLAEIDTQAGIVAMEAKLDKISEMISTKMERLGMIEEDANLAELVDKGKMKAMQKEIKILEKRKAKMEKVYEKMTGKSYTKEMVDETVDEEMVDSTMEQNLDNYNE